MMIPSEIKTLWRSNSEDFSYAKFRIQILNTIPINFNG